ncbi:MAG: AAA family ATPase [Myxococcales bacterium]
MASEAVATHPERFSSEQAGRLLQKICDNVERALRGKREAVERAACAVVAGGHLLIEDVPGVGKTTLAQALARSLDMSFARVQFTSDLLPSDILGAQVFDPRTASFSFRPGPVFAHVVLADELNRAPPRTQSALLEAMSEGRVSLDGETRVLPAPFLVLATQNPREQTGTYPLPDSQLDRFMLRISLGFPEASVERELLLSRTGEDPLAALAPVASVAEVVRLQASAAAVRVEPSLADYMVALVRATRESSMLSGGASTRGLLSLQSAAKAVALLDGRDFLLPDDVKRVAVACLAHRIAPAGREASETDRAEAERILADLLERVEVPE